MVRVLSFALLLPLIGCGYDLGDGRYLFEREELLRETCAFEPPLPEVWEGDLQVRGSTLLIHFDDSAFPGTSTYAPLVGRFDPNDQHVTFRVASSAELERTVERRSCQVWAQLALVARLQDSDTFVGTLRLSYSRQLEADRDCPVTCFSEQRLRAARLPSSSAE